MAVASTGAGTLARRIEARSFAATTIWSSARTTVSADGLSSAVLLARHNPSTAALSNACNASP